MAEGKNTQLSIVIRTVDQATAKLKAINEQLDKVTKPVRDLKKQLGEFAEKSGLSSVAEGFKGVGEAAKESLFKIVEIGAVIGEVTHLVIELVDHFEELGKKSERLGVSVDFLAGMRDAAARTGVPMEALDQSLETFSQNIGQATTHTGRMYKFLSLVSPALRDQVLHAKNNAAAFDLIAQAMQKVTDPAKRAALAQKVFGDSTLAPLFAKGAKGIKEMRDRYVQLAGSQEEAVAKSEEVAESLHDLHATTDGLKAALVSGLAPALKVIVDKLAAWFQGHRADVKAWADDIGTKLPNAIKTVTDWLERAWSKATAFVDAIGGIKNAAIGVAAILAGPLIKAVVDLSLALLTAGGRAIALAKGVASIPAGVGGAAGGAAGGAGTGAAAGAAGGGGLGVVGSLAWPVALGFGAKYLLRKAGLDDLGGGDEVAQRAGKDSVIANWLKEGGFASSGPSPNEVVQQGIDSVRDADGRNLSGGFGAGGVSRGLTPQSAKVTIELKNAPKGTRVSTDPSSTADVDMNVGYQIFGDL